MQTLLNFATLLTAIAALFMILEMRRQRQTSYKPELVLNDAPLTVRVIGGSHFASTRDLTNESDATDPFSQAEVTSVNVGAGYAKNVTYEWECDYFALIEAIGKMNPEIAANITVDEQWLKIDGASVTRSFHHLPPQEKGKIVAVPPGAQAPIRVPFAYLAAFAVYAQVLNDVRSDAPILDVPDPVGLRLNLQYHDLGGSIHRKTIDVQPQISAIGALSENPKVVLRGTLQPTEA